MISVDSDERQGSPDREAAALLAGRRESKPRTSVSATSLAERASATIDELTGLAPGWDGYDAIPVLPRVARHAHRFLEAISEHTRTIPDVVPLSNGGVQLEWFAGTCEVEVTIEPDCATHVFIERRGEDGIREFPVDESLDVSRIAPLFRELR